MSGTRANGNVAARALVASVWLVGGFMFRRVAQLLITVVLARLLVPADFGLVALSSTLLLALMSITELSIASALIHERDPDQDDFDTAFTFSAIRGVLLALAMVGGGVAMAAIYHDDRLFLLTAALGIKPLFAGIASPRYVVLAKTLNFKVVTMLEAMAAAAQVLASVGVAYFTYSYWAIAAGLLVASMVGLVTSYTSAPCWPRFSLASWRKLMSFSSWMTLNQIASVVGTRFDTFMGGGILGTAAFGAYNVGSNLASLVTQSAMEPLERVLFPSFATIAHDRPRLRNAFQRSQACLLAFGLPLGIGMALVADPFVYLALGPKWGIAAEVIHYIAPVLALQIVFGPQTALAYALGATRMVFTRSLVMLVIRVPIVFAGLWWWGLTGLLVSRVISGGFMMSIVNMYMVNSLIGLSVWEQIRVAWRSLLSSGAMAVAVLLAATTFPPLRTAPGAFEELVVLVALGAVTYCGTHAVLWLVAGRPDGGVEVELGRIFGRLMGRINRQRQPAE